MLPPLFARPPADPAEERRIRRLAAARHAPASWLERARIITLSWDGAQVAQIATQLGCHPRTVYRWLHRFNQGGIDDLGDLPRSGRPRRLSELERGRILQAEGVRWRTVRSWSTSGDADFAPKGRRSSPFTPPRPRRRS